MAPGEVRLLDEQEQMSLYKLCLPRGERAPSPRSGSGTVAAADAAVRTRGGRRADRPDDPVDWREP